MVCKGHAAIVGFGRHRDNKTGDCCMIFELKCPSHTCSTTGNKSYVSHVTGTPVCNSSRDRCKSFVMILN